MAIPSAFSRVHVSLHTPRARCRAGSVALRPRLAWVPRASDANAEDASPSAAAATPVRTTHSAFACPVCGGATRRAVYASGSASLRCAAGHASDVAKEGHVNLLLRRAKGGGFTKKKKATGDTNEMVAARRAFLDAGHYAAAAETVAVTVARYLAGRVCDGGNDDEDDARLAGGVDAGSSGEEEDALSRTTLRDASRNASRKNKTSPRARRLDANKRRDARAKADRRAATAERSAHEREDTLRASLPLVVDFGCGEGYWLGKVAERVAARFAGVDASPFAAKAAARRLRGAGVPAEIAVGDAQRDLVFSDTSVDVALSVFAPRNVEELARVVKKGGLVVVVSPGDAHLAELRARARADASDALFGGARVLDAAADKRAAVLERFTGGDTNNAFEVVDELEHAGVMRLTRDDIASLLGMGPSAFHREGFKKDKKSASSDVARFAEETPGARRGERLEAFGADGAVREMEMDVTRAFVIQTFRRT